MKNQLIVNIPTAIAALIVEVVLGTFFANYFINEHFSLDAAAKYGEAATGLAALIALFTFWYEIVKDQRLAALDQITFFREKIIPEHSKFFTDIKSMIPDYDFPRIRTTKIDLVHIINSNTKESARQREVYDKGVKLPIFPWATLLNMLEEFALYIIYTKSADHEALKSVQDTFVLLVEQNMTIILIQKDILMGNNAYPGIIKLYLKWEKIIDRKTVEKRLEDIKQQQVAQKVS